MQIYPWLDIVNFGLVVLIWLVQLIIYPSFSHIQEDKFIQWHLIYVKTISVIVSPLMIIQMVLAVLLLISQPTATAVFIFCCIIAVWISSFTLSVPCHKKLSSAGREKAIIAKLVRTNWIRTILWSGIFLAGILL